MNVVGRGRLLRKMFDAAVAAAQPALALGLDPRASPDDNDAHGFFQALGDSVVTGPTLTNVNDFRALVIEAPRTGTP